jgi:DNA-binding protein HU-beta
MTAIIAKTPKLTRKDLAISLRQAVMATGAAISPKVAEIATVAYEEAIVAALSAGQTVGLAGFGVFSVVDKEETKRRNPQKPDECVVVPAHKAPKFKASSRLKTLLNGGEVGDEE